MHIFLRLFTLIVAITLVGCGAAIPTINPYKMDIQQGNVVTSEMLLKLRPGMTKSQVQFIMGTPLLVDSFHSNRWDYFYQLRKQGDIVNQRRVILDFEEDLLVRVRGDVVPKGQTAEDVKKQLEADAVNKAAPQDTKSEVTDENAPVIEPVEKPDIEAVDPAAVQPATQTGQEAMTSADKPAEVEEDAPASILAVPVPVVPPVSEQQAEPLELKSESGEVEAVKKSTMDAPAPIELQEGSEQSKSKLVAPEPIVNETQAIQKEAKPRIDGGKKKVFIMDNQLDTSRIQEPSAEKPSVEAEKSVVQELKENNEELDEEEPDFFERMLEKIGF
ncbi:MAG: outer membrane protein assembly factor BamE domain-containing protein [Methylophilaceae bacterium]